MEHQHLQTDGPDGTRLRRDGLVVERIEDDGQVRLRLVGDLDLATGPLLTQLTEIPVGGLLIDMSDVQFLDAAGIRALVALAGGCHREGQPFVLIGVGAFQRRIIELLDLSETLGLAPTPDGG
ncbi:MAG: STAS domain-containing protein [Microthrixaceae bacterium]